MEPAPVEPACAASSPPATAGDECVRFRSVVLIINKRCKRERQDARELPQDVDVIAKTLILRA
jgi:hypothetical protein